MSDQTEEKAEPRARKSNELTDLIVTLIIALAIALGIRQWVAEARVIPTGSMEPTILENDHVLTDKLFWHFYGLHRGMIVVFDPPFPSPDPFIKRLIGLPGDTVEVRDGVVLVNGQPLSEPYEAEKPSYTLQKVTVPAGHLFMMGDNRNQSNDSHSWGTADLSKVRGIAWLRYWPLNRLYIFHAPQYAGLADTAVK